MIHDRPTSLIAHIKTSLAPMAAHVCVGGLHLNGHRYFVFLHYTGVYACVGQWRIRHCGLVCKIDLVFHLEFEIPVKQNYFTALTLLSPYFSMAQLAAFLMIMLRSYVVHLWLLS